MRVSESEKLCARFRSIAGVRKELKMSEKYLFSRLSNQNYPVWKQRMEMLLKREDLWSVVSEPKPEPATDGWLKRDQKALATIVLYVEDSQLNLVRDAVTAAEVWKVLQDFHEKVTMTSRVALLRRICSLNMAEGGDIEKHLYDLEELFDRLATAGQALETPLKIAMIYRSLPESYGGLITALESRPDADQTLQLVKQKLLDEHQRRVERSGDVSEKAMKTRSKDKEKICYHCRKPGHFRRDCRLLKSQQKSDAEHKVKPSGNKAKKAVEKDVPICFAAGGSRRKGCWYVDSGCSSHMTSDKDFFDKLDESVKIKVILADGSVTTSAGVGEGSVKCVDGEGKVVDIFFK